MENRFAAPGRHTGLRSRARERALLDDLVSAIGRGESRSVALQLRAVVGGVARVDGFLTIFASFPSRLGVDHRAPRGARADRRRAFRVAWDARANPQSSWVVRPPLPHNPNRPTPDALVGWDLSPPWGALQGRGDRAAWFGVPAETSPNYRDGVQQSMSKRTVADGFSVETATQPASATNRGSEGDTQLDGNSPELSWSAKP